MKAALKQMQRTPDKGLHFSLLSLKYIDAKKTLLSNSKYHFELLAKAGSHKRVSCSFTICNGAAFADGFQECHCPDICRFLSKLSLDYTIHEAVSHVGLDISFLSSPLVDHAYYMLSSNLMPPS